RCGADAPAEEAVRANGRRGEGSAPDEVLDRRQERPQGSCRARPGRRSAEGSAEGRQAHIVRKARQQPLARIVHDDSAQPSRSLRCKGRTALLEPAAAGVWGRAQRPQLFGQYASALLIRASCAAISNTSSLSFGWIGL